MGFAGYPRGERVEVSEDCLERAREDYPPGGSVGGKPRLSHFLNGPLHAVKFYFARQFDNAPELAGGIRWYVTVGTSFFPPILFYAARVDDHIEVLDYDADDEWWELIARDPND